MQTGTANEAVNKRGPGRPPKQRSAEEEKIKKEKQKEKKRKKDRDYRANKKCKVISLEKFQELVMKFCKEKGIAEELEAFRERHEEKENEASQHSDEEIQKILKNSSKNPWETLEENLESEMIQTVGLEGVTATSSSSLGGMVNSSSSGELEILRLSLEQLEPWHGPRILVHFAGPPGVTTLLFECDSNGNPI